MEGGRRERGKEGGTIRSSSWNATGAVFWVSSNVLVLGHLKTHPANNYI